MMKRYRRCSRFVLMAVGLYVAIILQVIETTKARGQVPSGQQSTPPKTPQDKCTEFLERVKFVCIDGQCTEQDVTFLLHKDWIEDAEAKEGRSPRLVLEKLAKEDGEFGKYATGTKISFKKQEIDKTKLLNLINRDHSAEIMAIVSAVNSNPSGRILVLSNMVSDSQTQFAKIRTDVIVERIKEILNRPNYEFIKLWMNMNNVSPSSESVVKKNDANIFTTWMFHVSC